jgi:uncharacterized phage-associated protein
MFILMNDARAIANFVLDEFDAARFEISNKKINKLIYFCHGFSLLRLDAPLVKNHIEAWAHGPVVRVVYDAFKLYEYRPISERAKAFNFAKGKEEIVQYEGIDAAQLKLVKAVTQYYVKFSADELEELSHSHYGPWAKVWNVPEAKRGLRSRIPDSDIREYFREKHGGKPPVH